MSNLPENHKDIVEAIMVTASRLRSMAHSELSNLVDVDKLLESIMPYLVYGKSLPLIEACGKYLDKPYGLGFYNIVMAVKREAAVEMYLEIYQGIVLPNPDIKWCIED